MIGACGRFVEKLELKSIDEYERTWWVRLGRFLRLNRFEVFEVNATPQECIEFILALKNITYTYAPHKSKILIDTVKRPYRFVYIGYEISREKYAGETAYIKGLCLGKGHKTFVEIEAFPGKDVIAGCFFGAVNLGLFITTVERLLLTSLKFTPDILCFWILVVFMFLACCVLPISNRNSGVNRIETYLASLPTTTVVQSDEEQKSLLEEAPHQDSAQGLSSR
jgi:hypothetical protein